MITPSTLSFPFDLEGLSWRAFEFSSDLGSELTWGQGEEVITIGLPRDLQGAVAKRQSEYLAGRLCAALALRDLDLPTSVGRDGRVPVWPEGSAGSIAHSHSLAIAVASRRYETVGIDCESTMSDERAQRIAKMIYRPVEASLRPSDWSIGAFTTLAFSAKEAFYKAVSRRVGRVLGFHEGTLLSLAPQVLTLGFENEVHQIHWHFEGSTCVTLCLGQELL